ncbi:hypothetical protein ACFWPK_11760 [Nocardia sp. NPDC058519]|uniref:hypothetical protein n=1 Tax=Nocardia sp. NPDC058519 TaxID=3346535 RepID=UPI00365073AA
MRDRGRGLGAGPTRGGGQGKTYRVEHTLTREDGEVAATVSYVSGLLDLRARKLVADPARVWAEHARDPALLGLAPRPA